GAQISQPIPAEDAFDGHDQVLAIRLDGFQERLGTGAEVPMQQDFPLGIQDTEVHPASMQINAAVIAVTLGIESHPVSSSWKLDTSRSISNRYAPRGGLDEYQAASARRPETPRCGVVRTRLSHSQSPHAPRFAYKASSLDTGQTALRIGA